jgi:hypothetical protein
MITWGVLLNVAKKMRHGASSCQEAEEEGKEEYLNEGGKWILIHFSNAEKSRLRIQNGIFAGGHNTAVTVTDA